MSTSRLEAFSDGVMAILITIMVLELRVPHGTDWSDLVAVLPVAAAYVLSFVYIGIYWNNHHHMFQAVERASGPVLWANLHLLFWLSIVPFVTAWLGHGPRVAAPTAAYGVVMVLCAVAFALLERAIIAQDGAESKLAQAVGNQRKEQVSLALYTAAVPVAFVAPWVSQLIFVGVALLWLVPDRRVENLLHDSPR